MISQATAQTVAPETSVWESGLVAALVAATVVLLGYWWNTRAARLDRQRQLFAEAFGAVMEYREYPHIVRRRSDTTDSITADLSAVQAELNKYAALLRIESETVGRRYERLVSETRRIAGSAIRDGWDQPTRDISITSPGMRRPRRGSTPYRKNTGLKPDAKPRSRPRSGVARPRPKAPSVRSPELSDSNISIRRSPSTARRCEPPARPPVSPSVRSQKN